MSRSRNTTHISISGILSIRVSDHGVATLEIETRGLSPSEEAVLNGLFPHTESEIANALAKETVLDRMDVESSFADIEESRLVWENLNHPQVAIPNEPTHHAKRTVRNVTPNGG